jgi:hypothetical protein
MTTFPERLGSLFGTLSAPVFAAATRLRGARVFHPAGVVYTAKVLPTEEPGATLAGPAIVRLSGGAFRDQRAPIDVLGIAVRFGTTTGRGPAAGELDLVFGSFPSIFLLPIAPLFTRADDYLANVYYTGVPYDVAGLGRVALRLRPEAASPSGRDRLDRLARAVEAGTARLWVEARVHGTSDWVPLAVIVLEAPLPSDPPQLGFAPFRGARGFVPRGPLTAARAAAYPASQAARDAD